MARKPNTKAEQLRGKRLGKILSKERQSRGISQSDLAIKAKVCVDALRGLEQGRFAHPSLFSIAAIASALDVTVDTLLKKIALARGVS